MSGRMKFMLCAALVAMLAWAAIPMAIEPPNLQRSPLRINVAGYMYKPLVTAGAASNVTTWTSLDSGQVDTSESYSIIPGCQVNVSLKTDAAADTILTVYAYGSQSGNPADWILLDSLKNITSVVKSRTLHGTAASAPILTAGNPVLFRYVHFTLTADGDAAADTVNVTGWVVSTPSLD